MPLPAAGLGRKPLVAAAALTIGTRLWSCFRADWARTQFELLYRLLLGGVDWHWLHCLCTALRRPRPATAAAAATVAVAAGAAAGEQRLAYAGS